MMQSIFDIILAGLQGAISYVSAVWRAIPGSTSYMAYAFMISIVVGLLIIPIRGYRFSGLGSDTARSRDLNDDSKANLRLEASDQRGIHSKHGRRDK